MSADTPPRKFCLNPSDSGHKTCKEAIFWYCQELCANTTASLMKLVRRRPNRPRACSAWLAVCYLRQVTAVCSVFFPIHLFQQFHAHVALYAPLGTGDVPQPCTDQHQRRFSIREGSNHSRPSPNLTVQTFQHVVGS